MKTALSIRMGYFSAFIANIVIIGFVFILQYNGFIPCPLCILQRVMMVALSTVFFIGMLRHYKKAINITLSLFSIIFALLGMILAGRQAWLQYIPPVGQGECGVSLQYLLTILPINEVTKMVWMGGTECSELGWVFLGLSLAEWSLIIFGLFFIFAVLQLKRSLENE